MGIKRFVVLFLAGLLITSFIQSPVLAADNSKEKLKKECAEDAEICPMLRKYMRRGNNVREILTQDYKEEGDICRVVKNAIRSGLNTREVTKTAIELGHDACLVVRCAVDAKGNLEQIITGAIDAGATSDVCTRCAMNAGADPREIARILETGFGYSAVAGGGLTPVDISLPGGNTGGGVLSSSNFR